MDGNATLTDRPNAPLKTIGEISTLYRVSLRTLRFYESRGLVAPCRSGTQCLFSSRDEIRLQIILKGERLGFTRSEIEKLILARTGDDGQPG